MSNFEVRARLKVRDGKLEEFKRHAAEMMRQTRERDSRTLRYDWFLSDDGTGCEVREGYVDADGATPPKAFHDLVAQTGKADCVIGSRWLPGAKLHVEQSGRRQFASRIFHLIVELFFGMHIKDTQCGAKVMRREPVETIHSALRIADMAFDINLLYSLKRAGYRILEVPTEWTDQMGSKVNLFRTPLVMFLSVVRIRLIYWPWLYRWLRPLRPLEGWIYSKL